jgi:hypothetical protein
MLLNDGKPSPRKRGLSFFSFPEIAGVVEGWFDRRDQHND